MDNFEHIANISKGGTIAIVVVCITFIDQIEKVRNKFLLGSIISYACLMFIATITVSKAWESLIVGNFEKFANLMIVTQVTYVGAFTSLVFHSAYRATLILAPRFPHTAKAATCVALTQGFIHGAASYYWGMNIKANYGTLRSEISSRMEIVVLIYYSLVESILFLMIQYKIIQVKAATLKSGDTNKIKLVLYAKGLLRSAAYIVNIALIYVSLGNIIPYLKNWNYPILCPSFILMIILTDSTRFQECIEKLSPSTTTTTTSNSKKPTDSTIARTKTTDDKGPTIIASKRDTMSEDHNV
ncbi:uncharacterized protein SPPG_05458 [Spizellomyces punctatus DAOM BR117]|uniref:THH1/TOM1/TOM3 domain-containing protein n=1 Tax=Spizellomyces punctatus (strain DAOM BR117) TaxID=645134 RepID=A0A0L0HEM5_SPIPD|nr:uncharacterized protein SPPG_05458 [Spizellomyces punctatus DAOM BR117]KNC99203.1 hypothetical protein SPPG_05458 [Spizellomyces punctatus DAOM BR117]|eukprot:XP_016607243.1 hypothetical protein SPPG_05458 [Spizellomyces punctatus DAOM BR117]